jgi:hypothetical protein
MNLLRRNFHALLAGVDSLLALPAKIDRLIYGFHYLQLFPLSLIAHKRHKRRTRRSYGIGEF